MSDIKQFVDNSSISVSSSWCWSFHHVCRFVLIPHCALPKFKLSSVGACHTLVQTHRPSLRLSYISHSKLVMPIRHLSGLYVGTYSKQIFPTTILYISVVHNTHILYLLEVIISLARKMFLIEFEGSATV